MNKLFTKIVGVALGASMAVGVGVAVANNKEVAPAHAATTVSWGQSTALPGTATAIAGDSNVKIKTSSTNSYTNPIRVYANTTVTITTANSYYITSVTYNASSTGEYVTNAQNATVSPSKTATVSNKAVTWSYTSSENVTTWTFKPSAQTRCTSFDVTYDGGTTTKQATGISFSPSSVTVSGGDSGSFTPTLTGGSGSYEKTISWTSSDTSIIPAPANSEDGEVVNFTTTNPASNTTVTLTGTVVSPGSASASITITVNHAAEYTITYNANGGSGTMSDSINHVSANGFTAPTGMEFKEWNTQADGKGTTYAVGATVTADTDLYAIWQRLRYTTGFESSDGFTAGTTYNTTVTDGPAGKQWTAYYGTASTNNAITGDQSMQMRYYHNSTALCYTMMDFDIAEAHSISFKAKSSGSNATVKVYYSTNSGSSWTLIGSSDTLSTSASDVEMVIPSYVSSARFKVEFNADKPSTGNKYCIIDDVVIETQSATPTVTSVSLSPSDDITLKVGNSETYEVTISGTNLLGTETVDVVLTDDLGDYASVDADSGLKNGDTFTVTATDAGGIGELYISYNSGAVDSDHILVMTEEAKTMSSISVHASGTTSYFTGDVFSTTGFEIYANYTDETSEDVTSNSVFELMRSGSPVSISTQLLSTDTTVRVSYTESGSTQTTNITIEVVDDTVKTLGWGNRGTVDCLEGTTLGSAVNTSSWTFTATWESETVTYPTFGSGEGYVHVGLYTTSTPESEGASLSTSYAFSANDDGKYLVAFYNGVRTNSNKQVTITETLNRIDEPTEAGFAVATSISVGDTVYLASTVRELSGISTTKTKYGLATAFTGEPNKLYPLTVAAGSEDGSYSFANSDGSYLSVTNDNTLNVNATLSTSTSFTVSFDDDGNATIKSLAYTTRSIQYNASSGSERFANYNNDGQTAVQLWKDTPAGTKDIANKNLKAQHAAVAFANKLLEETGKVCLSDGIKGVAELQAAWKNSYDEFVALRNSLVINPGQEDEDTSDRDFFDKLIIYAERTPAKHDDTGDTLQNALARYDRIYTRYTSSLSAQGDFLKTISGRGASQPLESTNSINFGIIGASSNVVVAIIVTSVIALTAIGGYFFIRRRKKQY